MIKKVLFVAAFLCLQILLCQGSYTVQSGDNLSSIASRFGTSVGAIASANGISNPNLIRVGQVLTIPGSSPAPAPQASGSRKYTVQSGDNLSSIASRYGVSVGAIASANGISNPNLIRVGQVLTIPGGSGGNTPAPAPQPSGGRKYTVQSGDNLSSIASRYGVSVGAIASANGISNPNLIRVGQVLTIPGGNTPAPTPSPQPSGGGRYTVQSGDNLSSIASRFGTSVSAIAAANGISNPNLIRVGQVLVIPGGSGGNTPGPAPQPYHPVSGGITGDQLRAIMPNLNGGQANIYANALNVAFAQGNLMNCPRRSAFLAQVAHESGGLQWWTEFASGAAYEGRRDLGNIYPGDGVRFKGRGPIQLTGRNNYGACGSAIGQDLLSNPERVANDPTTGFECAIWFWNSRGLSEWADQNTQASFDHITLRVNGGYNGKSARDTYWYRARGTLGC